MVTMTLIGFVRTDDATGFDVDLYQCQKCKTIEMTINPNPECPICKES